MSINFTPFLFGAQLVWPTPGRWLLVLLITIPALVLGIIPFLRLNKKRRASSKHLIPFIIHMSLILVLSLIFAGIHQEEKLKSKTITTNESAIVFVVDMSDSNAPSKDRMNRYMLDLVDRTNVSILSHKGTKQPLYGLVVFGGTENDGIIAEIDPGDFDIKVPDKEDEYGKQEYDYLSKYEAKPDKNGKKPARDASNISAALDKASSLLSSSQYDGMSKKIVLLSDGCANMGNELESAKAVLNKGISLDCMYFNFINDKESGTEIQVLSFKTITEYVKEGQEVQAEIIVQSTSSVKNAVINLSDVTGKRIPLITGNNQTTDSLYVDIPEGMSRHTVVFKPQRFSPDLDVDKGVDYSGQLKVEETGVQAVKVQVTMPGGSEDLVPSNNTLYSWYTFETQGRILLVKGDDTQLSQIEKAQLIEKIETERGYSFDTITPGQFPKTLEELIEYDEIIFMNVNFSRLSDDPEQAYTNVKRFVEEVGRGVLFTLGDNIFDEDALKYCKTCDKSYKAIEFAGDRCSDCNRLLEVKGAYIDSPMNELFPVHLRLDEEKQTVGMVIVVDLSSSMKETVSNSGKICRLCDYYYDPTITISQGTPCDGCGETISDQYKTPTRYQMVVQGVQQVLKDERLAPEDYVGVIVFDQDYHVALEIQEIGDQENRVTVCETLVKELNHYYYAHYVDKLTGEETDIRINFTLDGTPGVNNKYVDGDDAKYALPEGFGDLTGGLDKANSAQIRTYGTSYKAPIQEASSMLARGQKLAGSLEIKQVIFMSDGAPNDAGSGYEGIVERMAKSGTVTSSIAIGINPNDTSAVKELDKIAVAGTGDLYHADQIDDLITKLFKIIEEMQGELLNKNVEVTPKRESTDSTIHQGMDDEEYDTIYGYFASEIKEDAVLALYVDAYRPLYAEHKLGNGKVCIYMSDLGNKEWTGDVFNDANPGKDEKPIKNLRLVENILVAPIFEAIDSTGLTYDPPKRDIDNITIEVETYFDITVRNETIDGVEYKEVIEAILYKYDSDPKNGGFYKAVEEVYVSAAVGGKSRIRIKTDSIDDVYVILLEQVQQYKNSNGEFVRVEKNAVKDRTALIISNSLLPEHDILNNNSTDGKYLLMSLSGSGQLLDLPSKDYVTNDSLDEDKNTSTDSGSNGTNLPTGSSPSDGSSDLTNETTSEYPAFDSFVLVEETQTGARIIRKNIDVPLVALALVLFILDILFRSFVIKKKKKVKAQMTDEEQIASMRGR